jgi:hypothetical protein
MSERTISFSVSPPVRPAPLYEAAIIFASTSVLFFACLYLLLPFLRQHHISWFATYNLVLAAPMFMLVGCASLAYYQEGRRLRWPDVRDRFRLGRMSADTWFWTAALSIFMFGGRYASIAAFLLVLLALCFDRCAGLKRRVGMAFGVAVFLALSWGIWQSQPFLERLAVVPGLGVDSAQQINRRSGCQSSDLPVSRKALLVGRGMPRKGRARGREP